MQTSDNDINQCGSGSLVSVFHRGLSYPNILVSKIKIKSKQIQAYNMAVNVDALKGVPVLLLAPTPEERKISIEEGLDIPS